MTRLLVVCLLLSGCASNPPSTDMATQCEGTLPDHGLAAGGDNLQRREQVAVAPPTAGDTLSATASPAIRRDLQHWPPVEVVGVSFVDGRDESHGTNRNEPQSGLIPTQWDADVIRLIPTHWDAQMVLAGQNEGRASATPFQTVPARCSSR